MSAEFFITRSLTAVQDALNHPTRSGLLLAGSSFVTVIALVAFSSSPLDYPAFTLCTIGALFFSLQHAITPSKTFSYTTFPTWYKEKTIFDCALLSNIWLTFKEKSVTAAFAVTEEMNGVGERQNATLQALQGLRFQRQIATIFNQQKERGLAVSDGANIYSLGIDAQFVTNRVAALAFVEKDFLCHPPKITTPDHLERFICTLHALLAKNLVNSSGIPIPEGQYRKGCILLPKDNVGTENAAIIQNVARKEPQSVGLFVKLLKQIEQAKNPLEVFRNFSDEEARVFSLGYDILYTDPEEIPAAMKQFCKDYLQKIQAKTDPLDLATWVHLELIKIHPFVDLNGHTSRTLASAELRRGGHSPIFIFDETAYIKAQEKRDPAIFRDFLEKTITLSAKLGSLLENEELLQRRRIQLTD